MENKTLQLLNAVNRAIIKFRGTYSAWSNAHEISYNEMLVLYTIREKGFCTQKQVCDSYLLPRQTMNSVIAGMRKAGHLMICKEKCVGREKSFVLTEQGMTYAAPFLDSLDRMETRAVTLLGEEKLAELTALMLEYDQALAQAMEEMRE